MDERVFLKQHAEIGTDVAHAEAANAIEREEERIRAVYAERDEIGKPKLYAWWKPDSLLIHYRIRAMTAAFLLRAGWKELETLRALDVGCGSGDWLRQLLYWGARAENLHGVDLLPERIARARELSPKVDYRVGNGLQLPFEDSSADLVSAHTVFSSILQPEFRQRLAAEMTRVLASQGFILIFDFRISHPLNPNTIGIQRREIARLFPGFRLYSQSLELAPPIARRIVPVSSVLAMILEASCPFLRTHAAYLLQR